MRSWSFLSVLILSTGLLFAAEVDLVEIALAAMDEVSQDRWAYTQTMNENGTEVVIRHDPSRPEGQRFSVVSVDDRSPTEAEEEKYLARANENGSDDDETDDGNEVRAMIDRQSLTPIEETETHTLYSFRPVADDEDDRKLYEHLEATLRLAKNPPQVEAIEMRNPKPFSLGFGIKIKQFELILTYAPVDGDVLPRTVSTRIVGRAMLFKKVEEAIGVTYSDYRRVDPGE
jgi:hypothetical protein